MAIQWTDDDKVRLKRTEVIIHQQNVLEQDLKAKGLPTDIHLVEYTQNNQNYSDAVRAARKSDIFDAYYDKLKEMGEGVINDIRNGYGNVKPNFYKPDQEDKNK
jgi:hypothetical protein